MSRIPLVAATITAAFVGWLWFHPGGDTVALVVSNLGLLAAALVAGIACLRRGSARAAGRRGWLLTAVSCFLWVAGQAIWTIAQLIYDRSLPFPSLGDVAYLAAIGVGIGALFAFLPAPRALVNRLRTMLDGLIVALAVLFIAWVTFLEAMVHSASPGDQLERILTLAYPVADIARFAVALIVVATATRTRRSHTLLAAGFAVLAVSDCIYTYLLNQDAYRTGDVLDAGWMLAFVLIMLAARCADATDREGASSIRGRMTGPYLPVAAAAAVLAARWWAGPGIGTFEASIAGAILVLVGARHILTHFENLSLTGQLEAGVEEIRRREQQLNEAQSLAAVGSWEADLATGSMTASDTLYRLAGHEPGGIAPDVSTFGTFVHPEDRDVYQDAFAEACRTGRPASIDYRIIRRDGSERWTQSRFEVITDPDGTPVRVRGTSQDITERRQAEQALRQSDERLRSLVEASPLAIIEYDREGAVRFWNAAAETIYGWARTDVEGGQPPFSTPQGAATFGDLFERVLSGEQVHVDRLRRGKDGQPVHVSVSMAPLRGPDGAVVGVSSAGLDITHQRRLEDDLRQAQKMELIGRLAGGISHDFNNILTVVIGQGEMLLAEADPDGSVAARVRAIQDAARRAAELTDQLLTFSRRQVTMGEPADLNSVVAAMHPVLKRMIGGHIDLDLRLCADELVVPADVSQLQQLVLNLVVNACEAMRQGGRVTIATATAGALSGPTTAVLRVADTGVGMDESTRAHVFEPFFTTKEEGEGTGLGLAAVYGIVRQHGGDVHVASLPDAGSVFTVSLPLIGAAGSGMEPPAAPSPDSRATGTVLLVEDEATVRELAREVLELQGHVVLEAGDGAEALAVADAHGGVIDVLLTDVVLPQIPGPELADRLVAARPGLRVIFMSGYAERHLASIEDRRSIFLAKPFRAADLAAAVAAEIIAAAGLPSSVG